MRQETGGSSKIQKVLAAWGVISLVLILLLFITQGKAVGTLFTVVGLIKSQSLNDIKFNQMITGATAGIVGALNDPYSQYLDHKTRQELNERMSGEFGGIGVYVLEDEAGSLRLIAPIEGTPAYKVGVKHNDIILRIDGESIMNMSQDDVVDKLRGEPGTQVGLTVYREIENIEVEFHITREIISVPSVSAQVIERNPRIGYVRLSLFQSHSHEEMQEKIDKLLSENEVDALVVDVRDNGGGDFDAALAISSLFLNGEEIVSVADANGNRSVRQASEGGYSMPMVVLVNRNSASASEIFAGALQDNKRAEVVGEKTYGKALVQTVYLLPDGGALKLTTAKYYTPNGNDINEIGIQPDYLVVQPTDETQDLQLMEAIELLESQLQ